MIHSVAGAKRHVEQSTSLGEASVPVEQVQNQTSLPTQSAAVAAQPTTVPAQPTQRPTSVPTAQGESSQVPLQQAPDDEEEVYVAPPEGSETYVVADGDTLSDIASDYGVTTEEIVSANQLDSPDDLQVGDELAIPPPAEDEEPSDGTSE